jgi:ribosome-associated protein
MLVDLPSGRYDKLIFPEPVKRALDEARRLTAHGARKRQLQLVATIMEQFEISDVEVQLKKMDHKKPVVKQPFSQESESKITKLLSLDETELYRELQDQYSIEQLNTLRREIRVARKSLEKGLDRIKVYKELLHYIQ